MENIKNGYELVKETLERVNKENGYEVGFTFTEDEMDLGLAKMLDFITIRFNGEKVVEIITDYMDQVDNPLKGIIEEFYNNNKRAKAKNYNEIYTRKLNSYVKKALKSDLDEDVLENIKAARKLQTAKDELKEDIEWTKKIARDLYTARDMFENIGEEE